ncbi:type VI secretion system protein TssA [bacterium]|nr:type VI secretion system protein TssA [bacterium]
MMNDLPIELEDLLLPISKKNPAGESLRYEETYDRIKEARREDDPNLSQGVWQTAIKHADWTNVTTICAEALTKKTKDLQIAVWLLESWLHEYGISGIITGIGLLRGLCETFWDGMYPELNSDGPGLRLAPIRWMNDKLSLRLKEIPVTQPRNADIRSYTFLDWENALHLENLKAQNPEIAEFTEEGGPPTKAHFYKSAMLSPTSFYVDLKSSLLEAIEAAEKLEAFLKRKCGDTADLNQFKSVLQNVQVYVDKVLTERETKTETESQGLLADTDAPAEVVGDLPISSRNEAYRQLADIADYLLKVEPHSPTPYLVKRAVSWGGLSLDALLQELVHDPTHLQAIYALLGIRP